METNHTCKINFIKNDGIGPTFFEKHDATFPRNIIAVLFDDMRGGTSTWPLANTCYIWHNIH
jgi:hypothetical protein